MYDKVIIYVFRGPVLPDTKTCHKCGSDEHLVNNCDKIKKSDERRSRLDQLDNVYRRYNIRRPDNFSRENRFRDEYNNKSFYRNRS